VFAQPDRLRQVARNLVRNAVQAAGAERVRVSVEGGPEVRLRVEDDGPGLTPEALARVFDRYVSGRAGGVGVGLTVARRIVASFDGRIEARSSPGAGPPSRSRCPAGRRRWRPSPPRREGGGGGMGLGGAPRRMP
jgi:signal transduction histidine kinase